MWVRFCFVIALGSAILKYNDLPPWNWQKMPNLNMVHLGLVSEKPPQVKIKCKPEKYEKLLRNLGMGCNENTI